jgi:SOS-response transcriptional repressor LexA
MGTRGQSAREGEEIARIMLDVLDEVCKIEDCKVTARTIVITAVNTYLDNTGFIPTEEEIEKITGFEASEITHKYLKLLKEDGELQLDNTVYEEGKDKPTRLKVLEAIKRYNKTYGISPSVRDLCAIVGLSSTSTVYGHLKRLQKKGKITWKPGMPRSIRLL